MDRVQGFTLTLTGAQQNYCLQVLKDNPQVYKYLIASTDTSDTGNNHIHVLLWLRNNKRVSNIQTGLWNLDEAFISSVQYCEPVRSLQGITNYILKKREDGFKLSLVGDVPKTIQKLIDDDKKELSPFTMLAMKLYKSREDCIQDFQMRASQKFIMSKASIMSAINETYPLHVSSNTYKIEDFNVDKMDFSNNKSKIVVGPTGIGKTQWAKAHFNNPIVITDKESWTRYDPELHDGIVIDDMTFEKNNPVQFLHLLDMREPSERRVLYGVKMIPAFVPRIFTCNKQTLFWPESAAPETVEAYKTRAEVIEIVSNNVTLFNKEERPDIHWDVDINTSRYSTHPSGLPNTHVPYNAETIFGLNGFHNVA